MGVATPVVTITGYVVRPPPRVVAIRLVSAATARNVRPALAVDLEACLRDVADGDRDALGDFYDATNRLVFGMALRILRDRDLAEDVVADVYGQVWRTAGSYDRRRGAPAAWLLTMARSRAIDVRRSRGREPASDALETIEDLETEAPGPEDLSALSERRQYVIRALTALTREQREVIDLAFYGGLSHSEIAARLGQPLGTVKTRIRMAMLRLRDQLAPLATDPPTTPEEPAA